MKTHITKISKAINIAEGDQIIEQFLITLYFYEGISTKELAQRHLIPIPIATAIKKEAIKLKLIIQDKGVQLTDYGRRFVEEELGYKGINKTLYLQLMNSEIEREAMIVNLATELEGIFKDRPEADVTIDQSKCTVETALKRAMLSFYKRTIIGKKILCLGDDDLVSIATAVLYKKIFNKKNMNKTEIIVMDCDERVLNYIRMIATKLELPIICLKVDFRHSIEHRFLNYFDCFYVDAPYTLEGLTLFLSRGVDGLKKQTGLLIFLSFAHKPSQVEFQMQQLFSNMGLIINERLRNFNEYEGASILGSKGQLLILETTAVQSTIISQQLHYHGNIYTGEVRKSIRKYKCKSCNQITCVGSEMEIKTIEQLKENGCSNCTHHFFERIDRALSHQLDEDEFLGEHTLVELFGCNAEQLNSMKYIKIIMEAAAIEACATIIISDFHHFEPWGISGVVVIQESHLTIHTWPEYQYAAIDLFTCGTNVHPERAFAYLQNQLNAEYVIVKNINRGNKATIKQYR